MSRSYDALVVDDVGVLSGVRDDEAAAMEQVVRRARTAGLRTGLLSNAGGTSVDATLAELEVLIFAV